MNPGDLTIPWRTSNFDLEKLAEASIKLKKGDLVDKLRYLTSMKAIEKAGLRGDPDFESTLASWLSNADEPLKLRRQLLTHEWTENNRPLSSLLSNFKSRYQVTLIQNFLDTPRYRELVLSNKKSLPYLMTIVRRSKKMRNMLIEAYSPRHKKAISLILDAQDVSDEVAIKVIKKGFDSPELLFQLIEGIVYTLSLIHI